MATRRVLAASRPTRDRICPRETGKEASPMHAHQTPTHSARRPGRPKKTPAEKSAGFAATQVRLKQEAAGRRAVVKGSPRASGTSRIGHGHRG